MHKYTSRPNKNKRPLFVQEWYDILPVIHQSIFEIMAIYSPSPSPDPPYSFWLMHSQTIQIHVAIFPVVFFFFFVSPEIHLLLRFGSSFSFVFAVEYGTEREMMMMDAGDEGGMQIVKDSYKKEEYLGCAGVVQLLEYNRHFIPGKTSENCHNSPLSQSAVRFQPTSTLFQPISRSLFWIAMVLWKPKTNFHRIGIYKYFWIHFNSLQKYFS